MCAAMVERSVLGSVAARAASGRPPMRRCRPVAATGSQCLLTHRTMRVPAAMLCAARNMNTSPLKAKVSVAYVVVVGNVAVVDTAVENESVMVVPPL